MKKSTVLKRALSKIKKNWIQGASARNKKGDVVPTHSPNAVSFCAVGAIQASIPLSFGNYFIKLGCFKLLEKAKSIYSTNPIDSIIAWNDVHGRTKEEVIKTFEKAIKLALKEEAK